MNKALHKIPEKMDMKDAFEYNELPMSKDPNDCGIGKASHKKLQWKVGNYGFCR